MNQNGEVTKETVNSNDALSSQTKSSEKALSEQEIKDLIDRNVSECFERNEFFASIRQRYHNPGGASAMSQASSNAVMSSGRCSKNLITLSVDTDIGSSAAALKADATDDILPVSCKRRMSNSLSGGEDSESGRDVVIRPKRPPRKMPREASVASDTSTTTTGTGAAVVPSRGSSVLSPDDTEKRTPGPSSSSRKSTTPAASVSSISPTSARLADSASERRKSKSPSPGWQMAQIKSIAENNRRSGSSLSNRSSTTSASESNARGKESKVTRKGGAVKLKRNWPASTAPLAEEGEDRTDESKANGPPTDNGSQECSRLEPSKGSTDEIAAPEQATPRAQASEGQQSKRKWQRTPSAAAEVAPTPTVDSDDEFLLNILPEVFQDDRTEAAVAEEQRVQEKREARRRRKEEALELYGAHSSRKEDRRRRRHRERDLRDLVSRDSGDDGIPAGLPSDGDVEQFTLFFTKRFPFSNHYPCNLKDDDGRNFICTEQYYMYMKAKNFGDHETAEEILQAFDAKEIKQLGRSVKNFDEQEWHHISGDIMFYGNFLKFTQNTDLRLQLFKTMGTTLVEASPNDTVWGIGLSIEDPRARCRSQWRGENRLGELLTKLRDNLMQESKYEAEIQEAKEELRRERERRRRTF